MRLFGAWDAPVQLRFTTKFAGVAPLIGLAHGGRVRVRMSVNAAPLMRFEGGTNYLPERVTALGALARDGYKVGLTVAPIQPVEGLARSLCRALRRCRPRTRRRAEP